MISLAVFSSGVLTFARYATAGAAVNVGAYAFYIALTAGGIGPKTAVTVSFLLALLVGFSLHRRWTFRGACDPRRALQRYLIANMAGYFLNIAALYVFVDVLRYRHEFVQGITVLFLVGFMFALQKLWVFNGRPTRGGWPVTGRRQ